MLNTVTSPKVSIILPTYNRAEYIMETIESIRNQTYQNWELIIVDDGSDDNTEEIVTRIKDERIIFYKCGRIGIGGKIKNIGLDKATGDLIAFIDSDDLWANTKMQKQVAALQNYPQAGFSLTGGYNFKKAGEPIEYFYKQKQGMKCDNIFISLFSSEIAGFAQVLMFRKECVVISGIFKEVKSFSDLDFIISLARHFKAVVLYEPLVYRRIHDENYIHSNWEKSYYEGIEIIQSYKNDDLLPSKIVRNALVRLYFNFGEDCLVHKKPAKAIKIFFYAWKHRPFSIVPFKKIGKAILYAFKK